MSGRAQDQQAVLLPEEIPMYELLRLKRLDNLCDPTQGTFVYETVLVGYTIFSRPGIFGGISLGVGMQAAFASLFDELDEKEAAEFRAYSYQGAFLGPALSKFAIRITVTTLRKTRSFVTRVVTLSQQDPARPDVRRNTLVGVCDFARRGRKGLPEFSAPAHNPLTNKPWQRPEELPSESEDVQQRIEAAKKSNDTELIKNLEREFAFSGRWNPFLEYRIPTDSVMRQTFWGTKSDAITNQDELPPTDRVMADWFRVKPDLSERGIAAASAKQPDCVPLRPVPMHTTIFTFLLDQIVPLTPILIQKIPRRAASPDVSLDFSIRFHREDGLDVNKWTLRHWKGLTAAAGRSFSQVTLWNEQGDIIATMSQQGHYVPAPPRPNGAAKPAAKL
ncbi:hypothetical protein OC845_004912 [Tilletia horrida]|nr:hypothetical protein OC845_004912 [Tilletia horrida]